MSRPSNVPQRSSPPASVRSDISGPDGPEIDAMELVRPGPPPKSLSQTGRSKTAPLSLNPLWTPSVDRPQLSERDSIFATTYLASDSPASSPHFPPRTTRHSDDAAPHGTSSDKGIADSSPPRLTAAHATPTRANRDQRRPQTPTHHSLLSAHFNSVSRNTYTGMSSFEIQESPPPFMSPVDSPLHRPVTPPNQVQPAAPLDDDLVESEERIKNRLWREGKGEPYLPHKGTPQNLLRAGHVDKKIEATLAKIEQPTAARSRKASHYLRVFKENDAAEEQKKREVRAKDRRLTDKSLPTHPEEPSVRSDRSALTEQLQQSSQPSSVAPSPAGGPVDSYFDQPPGPTLAEAPAEEYKHKHTIPAGLLDEIRNFANLTPGAGQGSSFSKSLPTAAAEKLRMYSKARPQGAQRDVSGYTEPPRDGTEEPSPESEEEDSERELISSALYFPHRQLKSPGIPPAEQSRRAEVEAIRKRSSMSAGKGFEMSWDKEEPIKTPQEVEISLHSKDTNSCLHGDIATSTSLKSDAGESPAPAVEATISTESDYESMAESSHSYYESESSATEDLGTTPKATPMKKKAESSTAGQPPAPLGAVELKPYDHQVGGHTTVYRFSRRAVCKQLNNRENEFYETVERHHPELLEFLPRYIGVLNVTYRKAPKKKKTHKGNAKTDAGFSSSAADAVAKQESGQYENQPRVVSHSQQSNAVPEVIFENNRHIIPDNLFRVPPRSSTPDPWNRNASFPLQFHRRNQSDVGLSSEQNPTRPPIQQQSSWGVTTINRKLQEEVLRQVFAPPPIHHRHRHHRTPRLGRAENHLARSIPSTRRNSTDVSIPIVNEEQSTRKQVLKAEAHRNNPKISGSGSVPDGLGEAMNGLKVPPSMVSRRRHSGGGLTRRPCGVDSDQRSNLEFYEEEGYGGDGEEEVFAMDEDHTLALRKTGNKARLEQESTKQPDTAPEATMLPAPLTPKAKSSSPILHNPHNPKEAQQQPDERVQHFLLLEDLTAGMSRPCVLDLKMGTRQYGIEADDKKQRSQRRKCQMTTSRELGVRVCGMQIWNVKTQSYIFEDKYYGRDLKAGKEFQDALKRFFWDGNGHKAALRHIPVILEKINALENMIRHLPGYRFYASSLLMLYDRGDGEIKEKDSTSRMNGLSSSSTESFSATTSPSPNGPTSNLPQQQNKLPEIKLKIVDFANCVTAEDPMPEHVPCPPTDPNGVDRGYLRGLRSLRLYFQRIWRDINDKDWVERDEGEGMLRDSGHGSTLRDAGPGWMEHHGNNEESGYVSI